MYKFPFQISTNSIKYEVRLANLALFPNSPAQIGKKLEGLNVWRCVCKQGHPNPVVGQTLRVQSRMVLVLSYAPVLVKTESGEADLVTVFGQTFDKFSEPTILQKVVLWNAESYTGFYVGVVLDEEYDRQKPTVEAEEEQPKKRISYFNARAYMESDGMRISETSRPIFQTPIVPAENPDFVPNDLTLSFGTQTRDQVLYKIIGTNQFGHKVIYQQGFVPTAELAQNRLETYIQRINGVYAPIEPKQIEVVAEPLPEVIAPPTPTPPIDAEAEYLSKWERGEWARGWGTGIDFLAVAESGDVWTRYYRESDKPAGLPKIGNISVWFERGRWLMKNTFYEQGRRHPVFGDRGKRFDKKDRIGALQAAEKMLLNKLNYVSENIRAQLNLFDQC